MAILVRFRQNTITSIPFINHENIRFSDHGVLRNEEKYSIVIGTDRIIVAEKQPIFDIPIGFRDKEERFCLCFRNFKPPAPSHLVNEERKCITFAGNRILTRKPFRP